MKKIVFIKFFVITLVFGFVSTAVAMMNTTTTYKINKSSKLWFDGTSTLHDFRCDVKNMWGSVKLTGDIFSNGAGSLSSADLTIPVKYIINEDEDLTENMHEALNEEDHPKIFYKLTKASLSIVDDNTVKAETQGKLTISGVTKPVDLSVVFKKSGGSIILTGDAIINMIDFGIDPPTMFLGAVSTDEEIKVYFEFSLIKE
jgi:polyisoprenoid-binding protein YceI